MTVIGLCRLHRRKPYCGSDRRCPLRCSGALPLLSAFRQGRRYSACGCSGFHPALNQAGCRCCNHNIPFVRNRQTILRIPDRCCCRYSEPYRRFRTGEGILSDKITVIMKRSRPEGLLQACFKLIIFKLLK